MNSKNEAGESPVSFTGAQGQSGKTECVLIYDPATGTFTLEKLLSTFTLNLTSSSANLHQPLTLPKYKPGQSDSDESDNGSSEGDIAKADKENPFDYRHFINNKFEVPTTSSRIHDKTRQLEGLESLSDRDASGEDDVEQDILPRPPLPPAPPLRQTLPARPRNTSAARPKPKSNPRVTAASKKSASVPVPARRRGATPTESIDLTPTPHPQTGDKRPRQEESSSESDVDEESEESEEDEETEPFAGSGELIIEGEDVDERNNSSRSTTVGSSWTRANRGGPISLSATAGDVDMTTGDAESASDEEEETTPTMNGAAMPSPYNAPISLSGQSGNRVVEDETSSDEDEDEEPRHHYHQQQQQHVPTPNGVDEYEEEEEEEGEYDLENMMEELLEEQEENSASVDINPISLGGVRDDEESSSEEE